MKKTIDLNNEGILQEIKTIVPYISLGIFGLIIFEYFYFFDNKILLILFELENLAKMQEFIYILLALLLALGCLCGLLLYIINIVLYIYQKHKYGITYAEFVDFKKKAKKMCNLKVALRRVRANIDDEYPLIELKKVDNMYILHVYKNHWFNKEQIEKNTDFFKSVLKLPLYKIVEDYDKVTMTFTAEEVKINYKDFMKFFEQGKILIGYDENLKPLFWDFNTIPHLLGVGTTGSGKSNFMKILIDCLVLNGADVKFADGKRVEMVRYQFMGYKVYTENFLELFRDYHAQMMKRYARMEQESIERQEIVNHYTLLKNPPKPSFLIIDEWASITDNLSKDIPKGSKVKESEYKEAIRLIKDIGQLGRAGGIQIIMFMQDPKGSTLDTSIRNNMNMRVLLGRVKEKTAYDMLFGSEYRNLEPQKGAGSGYYMSNDDPEVFKVPLWEDLGITNNMETVLA